MPEPKSIHLLNLAAALLDDYAERLGNDGCNDWHWPPHLSSLERRLVVGDEWFADYGTEHPPPNWVAVQGLAEYLRSVAQAE